MLTRGDDYPIHQTPDPIAYTSSRDFYDRYFFNGYEPDLGLFFAAAFAVYPQLNLVDAHFAVLRDGVQHAVHASRVLHMERMDLNVGPITLEILEPLQRLRVLVRHEALAADLVCEGRAFPVEEPRFTQRIGPRIRSDYTRMTQNVRWSGSLDINGTHHELAPGTVGTRDRSWGVRAIGAPDPQPVIPKEPRQFFWMWTPSHFQDLSLFFVINAEASGRPWNVGAAVTNDNAGQGEHLEAEHATGDITFIPGTRHPHTATAHLRFPGQPEMRLTYEPSMLFTMQAIGYGHQKWGHGRYVGELEIEYETTRASDIDPLDPRQNHIQAPSRVRLEQDGSPIRDGIGTLETVVLGPYEPYGLTGLIDPGAGEVRR
jgi:hypothetical protein